VNAADAVREFDRRIVAFATMEIAKRMADGWPPELLAEYFLEMQREAIACRQQMPADIAALAPIEISGWLDKRA
jgi:hypothetical protein